MRLIAGLVAVIGAAATLAAQPSSVPPNEPLALVNANVVNVRDGRVTSGATIVLRDGRIESVSTQRGPAGVKTLDLKGKYVLPGLIDAHTHAADFPSFRRALESGRHDGAECGRVELRGRRLPPARQERRDGRPRRRDRRAITCGRRWRRRRFSAIRRYVDLMAGSRRSSGCAAPCR